MLPVKIRALKNRKGQIRMSKGHIFLGIPTAGKMISTGTSKSLYRLALSLQKADITTSLYFTDSADIIENRNTLSAFFLESKASHCLMIDSDIEFEPKIVADMLNLKTDIVGAAYPKRRIDMQLFAEAYSELGNIEDKEERFRAAKARASQFPFVVKKGRQVQNGFVSADGVPAGLLLIRRSAFNTMIEQKDKADLQELGATPLWPKGGHHGFFDRVWVPEKKYWLSEDLSFCHRWVKCLEKELFAYIGPGVTHHGDMAYDANFLDFVKNQKSFKAPSGESKSASKPTAKVSTSPLKKVSAKASSASDKKKKSAKSS